MPFIICRMNVISAELLYYRCIVSLRCVITIFASRCWFQSYIYCELPHFPRSADICTEFTYSCYAFPTFAWEKTRWNIPFLWHQHSFTGQMMLILICIPWLPQLDCHIYNTSLPITRHIHHLFLKGGKVDIIRRIAVCIFWHFWPTKEPL